jgi:hypothetical protein
MSFPFIPPRGKEEEAIQEYRSNIRQERPYVAGAAVAAAAAVAAPEIAALGSIAAPTVSSVANTVANGAAKIPWSTTLKSSAAIGAGVGAYEAVKGASDAVKETLDSTSFKVIIGVVAIMVASRFFSK